MLDNQTPEDPFRDFFLKPLRPLSDLTQFLRCRRHWSLDGGEGKDGTDSSPRRL